MLVTSVAKWSTAAAVGGGVYHAINGSRGTLFTPLGRLHAWQAGALVAGATSMFSEAINAWILPHVSKNKRLKYAESHILLPAAGGAGFAALAWVLNKEAGREELIRNFLIGAGAEILGQWVYESVVYPLVDPDDKDFQ